MRPGPVYGRGSYNAWEAVSGKEIGLTEDHIEVIGRMPDYAAGTGYRIAPVLAIVRPGFRLTINEAEVKRR